MAWMPWTLLTALAVTGAGPLAEETSTVVAPPPVSLAAETTLAQEYALPTVGDAGRRPLESDRAFPGFIGPTSNAILSKDPRSLTEARFLFINNMIDPASPLGSGDWQLYAVQLRLAVTERLAIIVDKGGYLVANTAIGPRDGWMDLAAGLKYTLIRDVENQFLVTTGLMFEPQTGEASVFQNHGDGLFTLFATTGKEIAEKNHLLATAGYQFPVNGDENSSYYYLSLHVDRQIAGWLYPLAELNWLHYVAGGNRGIPPAFGEGDGMINLGTSGVAGNDLVTLACGLKAILTPHAETGVAWEFPISNRHDMLNNRLTVEFILRY